MHDRLSRDILRHWKAAQHTERPLIGEETADVLILRLSCNEGELQLQAQAHNLARGLRAVC